MFVLVISSWQRFKRGLKTPHQSSEMLVLVATGLLALISYLTAFWVAFSMDWDLRVVWRELGYTKPCFDDLCLAKAQTQDGILLEVVIRGFNWTCLWSFSGEHVAVVSLVSPYSLKSNVCMYCTRANMGQTTARGSNQQHRTLLNGPLYSLKPVCHYHYIH